MVPRSTGGARRDALADDEAVVGIARLELAVLDGRLRGRSTARLLRACASVRPTTGGTRHLTRARADDQRDRAAARHEAAGLRAGRDHGARRDLGVLLGLGDDVEPVLLTGEQLGRDVDRIADHAGRDRDLLRSAGDDDRDLVSWRTRSPPAGSVRITRPSSSSFSSLTLVDRESFGTEDVAGLLQRSVRRRWEPGRDRGSGGSRA